jgi:hypothetical protein
VGLALTGQLQLESAVESFQGSIVSAQFRLDGCLGPIDVVN